MAVGYTKQRLIKTCISCKKEFKVYNNDSRKDAKFCTIRCRSDHYSGEQHPGFIHGEEPSKEQMRAYRRKYYENNRELCYQRAFIQKAKRREIEPGHTFEQWIELLKQHDNRCFYCKVKMTKKDGARQRTRDHIVPLSKGGTDSIDNIVPACKSCNSSKGTKTQSEFMDVTNT